MDTYSIKTCKEVMSADIARLLEWLEMNPEIVSGSNFQVSVVNNHKHLSVKEKIADLESALTRIDAGTFGICTECKGQIPEGRLIANPHFRKCTICQQQKGIRIY